MFFSYSSFSLVLKYRKFRLLIYSYPQEYLGSLGREQLIAIIVESTAHGNGSLQYIKDTLVVTEDTISLPADQERPSWCKCSGPCATMLSSIENKCCKKTICIAKDPQFKIIGLNKTHLEMHIRSWADMRAENLDFSFSKLRWAAYSGYILWQFGKLGKGNRKVVPSCIVNTVRMRYPSDAYTGFRES